MEQSELVVIEPVRTVVPAERAVSRFEQYQALQKALDMRMPQAIMRVGDKNFRKKDYWRAVGNGFRLSYQVVKEERIQIDDDWGYLFTVRATDPDGDYCDG